ncbi:MAG: hypothetical protein OIF50_13385 [Flavobacteriaceae bacterium]|nr:hypothetical protein [Flavobacteriaceae bacterium]
MPTDSTFVLPFTPCPITAVTIDEETFKKALCTSELKIFQKRNSKLYQIPKSNHHQLLASIKRNLSKIDTALYAGAKWNYLSEGEHHYFLQAYWQKQVIVVLFEKETLLPKQTFYADLVLLDDNKFMLNSGLYIHNMPEMIFYQSTKSKVKPINIWQPKENLALTSFPFKGKDGEIYFVYAQQEQCFYAKTVNIIRSLKTISSENAQIQVYAEKYKLPPPKK